MGTQEIIFSIFIAGVIGYSVVFYIRRFIKIRNHKYLREKYPEGFLVDGAAYTFFPDGVSGVELPLLEDSDFKLFDFSDFHEGCNIDCSFDFGDCFGGDGDGGDCDCSD